MIKKVKTNLAIMKKAKPYVNKQLLTNTYYSIVDPHFNHFPTIWDGIEKTLADKFQKLQNRAARITTSAPYKTVRTVDVFTVLMFFTSYEWECSIILM